jgi:hypothetical protein
MAKKIVVETQEEFYNDLRDEPCIVCGEPYPYVLGSYAPEEPKRYEYREEKAPVLYYTLCETCFNNGRIPTTRIKTAYRSKFGKLAA